MSMSKPKIPPPPPPPAKAPERAEVLAADDVQLGVPEEEGEESTRGRRALSRPAPSVGIAV